MLLQAEQFRRAAILLEGNPGLGPPDPYAMIPLAVCSAFSLEVYLKFLIVVEGGTPPYKHNHADLFSLVSQPVQQRIREKWNTPSPQQAAMRRRISEILNQPLPSFDQVLTSSAEAFQRLRYAYQYEYSDLGWHGGDIAECTRRVIFEMFPEQYADVRLGLPTGSLNASEGVVKAMVSDHMRRDGQTTHRAKQ